jgi:hypothetical protein
VERRHDGPGEILPKRWMYDSIANASVNAKIHQRIRTERRKNGILGLPCAQDGRSPDYA